MREDAPDLVLMDIVLKGEMDGIEAASQIRMNFNVPVIYVTSHADDKFLSRAKLTTSLGYILKPYETETLKAALAAAIEGPQGHDEKQDGPNKEGGRNKKS